MSETPGGSTEREGFSDDIAQLIVAVRALIGGHWSLFTAELEQALLRGEADLAIHSSKDLPTEILRYGKPWVRARIWS